MEEMNTAETIGPIVATADPDPVVHTLTKSSVLHNATAHAELKAGLAALEARIGLLEREVQEMRSVKASAETVPAGRKTVPFAPASLMAKGAAETGAAYVDDALRSLSIEQRIAVKSGLLRAGFVK